MARQVHGRSSGPFAGRSTDSLWHGSYLGPEVAADLLDLRGERLWVADAIQQVFTDDGHGDGRITPQGVTLLDGREEHGAPPRERLAIDLLKPTLPMLMQSRKAVTDSINKRLDASELNLHKPLRDVDWNQLPDERVFSDQTISGPEWVHYGVLRILDRSIYSRGFRAVAERYMGYRDGVLVGIAMELYHRRHRPLSGDACRVDTESSARNSGRSHHRRSGKISVDQWQAGCLQRSRRIESTMVANGRRINCHWGMTLRPNGPNGGRSRPCRAGLGAVSAGYGGR